MEDSNYWTRVNRQRISRRALLSAGATTALGAAFLAGLGTGMWAGTRELAAAWRAGKRFQPKMAPDAREAHLARWRSAVAKA